MAVLYEAWEAVTDGDPIDAPPFEATGLTGLLPSRLLVEDVALAVAGGGRRLACVATAFRAASALHAARTGERPQNVTLDREHVAAAVTSERWFRRGAVSADAGFAPLSKFWQTADGGVRASYGVDQAHWLSG